MKVYLYGEEEYERKYPHNAVGLYIKQISEISEIRILDDLVAYRTHPCFEHLVKNRFAVLVDHYLASMVYRYNNPLIREVFIEAEDIDTILGINPAVRRCIMERIYEIDDLIEMKKFLAVCQPTLPQIKKQYR